MQVGADLRTMCDFHRMACSSTHRFDAALDSRIQGANFSEAFATSVHGASRLLEKLLRRMHRRRLQRCKYVGVPGHGGGLQV